MIRRITYRKMMKIGVLSDTHKKVGHARKAIEHLLREGAEYFIHAGDIGKEEVLLQLKMSKKRYVAVYGNNDSHLSDVHNRYALVQEPHYFQLARTRIKLMHLPYYLSADSDVVIYGHTHTFACEQRGGTLFLNPGEACARSKPVSECAMLELHDERFEVTHYTRALDAETFESSRYVFERNAS